MSDLTDILNAMGGYQTPTQQEKDAVDALVATRGGRQKTGSTPSPTPSPTPTPTPSDVTIDPVVSQSGQNYTFTARRSGDTSMAAMRTMQVGSSSNYPPGSLSSDWIGGVFPTATAAFSAGSPTASFTITAPVAAQPE